MNNPRRSFLRRAFGMAVAAPALSRIIANGGPAPKPAVLPPISVRDFNPPVPMSSMSSGWYLLGTHVHRATTGGNYYARSMAMFERRTGP